jgi:hypothetical protein
MGAYKSYLLIIWNFIQLLEWYLFSFNDIFKIKFGSQKKYGFKFLRPNHLMMLIDENLEKYPSTFSFIDLRIINCEEKLIHEGNIMFITDISKKEPNLAEVPKVWKPEWVFEKISFTEWRKVRLSFLELIRKQYHTSDSSAYVAPGHGRLAKYIKVKFAVYFSWSADLSFKEFEEAEFRIIRSTHLAKPFENNEKSKIFDDLVEILTPFSMEGSSLWFSLMSSFRLIWIGEVNEVKCPRALL